MFSMMSSQMPSRKCPSCRCGPTNTPFCGNCGNSTTRAQPLPCNQFMPAHMLLRGNHHVVVVQQRCNAKGCTTPGCVSHYCDNCNTRDSNHRSRDCPSRKQQKIVVVVHQPPSSSSSSSSSNPYSNGWW